MNIGNGELLVSVSESTTTYYKKLLLNNEKLLLAPPCYDDNKVVLKRKLNDNNNYGYILAISCIFILHNILHLMRKDIRIIIIKLFYKFFHLLLRMINEIFSTLRKGKVLSVCVE